MPPICSPTVRHSAHLKQLSKISAGLNMSKLPPPLLPLLPQPPQPPQPSQPLESSRSRGRARARGRVRGATVTRGRGRGGGGGGTDHPDPPQHQSATDLDNNNITDPEDWSITHEDDTSFVPAKIRWDTTDFDGTTILVSWLATHPADCRVLFSDNKKNCSTVIGTDRPLGKSKANIYLVIARHVFENDPTYGTWYAVEGNQPKFKQAIANHLAYLRGKYKAATNRFWMTGAGINPLDPLSQVNLQGKFYFKLFKLSDQARTITAQVSSEFPWFEDLDALWKDNPAFAPKTFSSIPGNDCAGALHALTQPKHKQTSRPTSKQVASHPANSSAAADDSMVCSQEKRKRRAPNFEPNDAPHPTASQDLSNTNSNLDNMDADLNDMYADNSPGKGMLPATFIGGHNPPYDHTYDDFDPVLEERDTGNWDDGAEELEMEVDNKEQDNTQRPSNKHPHQRSPSPSHTFKPTHHTPQYDCREAAFTGKSRVARAMEHGSPCAKKPVSMSSLSANTPSASAWTFTSSPGMVSQDSQTSLRPSWKKAAHKRSLLGRVQSGTSDVLEQVSSLTNDMSYIYSAKESASEYKIAKVNALCHERNIQFQREQGVIERNEAASVHQQSQEAKALELHLLEAQAKVQSEKAAALRLEIELITLKEGSSLKET
ncbi:uncharacterized protein F5891DRAFT_1187851 [Suillus fuscotomentosus]|uniref:Uncharacterized protein n=1 Tax=Suillus fuscotomentosus TaxID=1912939 RepID=A0AAD4E7H5_9AGAM|nr:uncharacterized protein F5891DRAFT_1187851 [Suillus fuscotomentosus]KAG1901150.1 hypothetical protein F5891DRAFT_1187851 [Suillus fuscotomentosus]